MSCSEPAGVALDGAGNVWVADRGNNRIQAFTPDGALLQRFGERGVGAGQFIEPTSVSVACNGLVTVADADNNRAQQFQFAPSTACSALPAVKNPPDPILYNQPQPLPPEVTVRPTRTTGILAIRQLPLRISSDLPAKIAIRVTLTPRSGKRRPDVRMTFSPQNLPAGRTVTYRPRLSAAGVRTLRRALGSRRGPGGGDPGRGHQRRQLRRRRHPADKCDGLSGIWRARPPPRLVGIRGNGAPSPAAHAALLDHGRRSRRPGG